MGMLDFSKKDVIVQTIIKSRRELADQFRSEGNIHLSKWSPEVWNYDNFLKGGCHHGKWNCKMV